jgi:hypothetical protein
MEKINEASQPKTPEQIQREQYEKLVNEVRSMEPEKFIEYLKDKHRSDTYIVIRDIMTPAQRKGVNADLKLKKEFGVINMEAKQSWDHDHRQALMSDVDKACTSLYSMILKLMRANNDDIGAFAEKIQKAVNRIEEKLGYEQTVWVEQPPLDPTNPLNQESIAAEQGATMAEGDANANS